MDEALLRVWDTLCHFDVVQAELAEQQFEELRISVHVLFHYVKAEARREKC